MKIAILKSNVSCFGGLERYALNIAKAFAKKGLQVVFLTTGPLPTFSKDENIEFISLCMPTSVSIINLIRFDALCKKWLIKNKIDLVFGFDRNSMQTHYRAGNGVHATYLNRRKYTDSFFRCLSFAVNPLHRYLLKQEKRLFENPNLKVLITNSEMVRSELLSNYSIDKEKIHVIHNGVNWADLEEDFSKWEEKKLKIQKEYHINPKAIKLLFIGNGYRRKGLHLILKALGKCVHPFHLFVIGKDRKQKQFESLARSLSIYENISFLGPQKNIISFYQASDVLLIPSVYDPFANVTLEALAMGLFVISSKFNGGSEVLTKDSGYIIEDLFNVEALKKALQKAFEYKKTFTSAKVIRNIVKKFEVENQLEKIITLSLMYA